MLRNSILDLTTDLLDYTAICQNAATPEFLLEHTGQILRILESQGIGNLRNWTICKTMNLLEFT